MHAYTIRPVFWSRKINKQGTGPIMIAVTLERKVRYYKTPYRIREDQWKDNQVVNHANATLINRALRGQVHEIEAEILSRDAAGELITSRTLKAPRQKDLFDFVKEVQKNMPAATRRRYTCEANRLKAFAGERLALKDVTTAFLRDYEQHERKRGMAQNTLNTSFRWVKAILNKARKEGLLRELPSYTTPKYVQPERIYLVEEELQEWVKYWREKKVDGSLYNTLTWFLFGCYSGLRYSDWGQFNYDKQVQGNLLLLRAAKNGRWIALPIGNTLGEIITVAKGLGGPISADKTRQHLKILAGRIGCMKHVTTHTGRHTACAMFARLRLPKSVAAELLGISEKVVSVYYHLTGQDITDQASVLFKI